MVHIYIAVPYIHIPYPTLKPPNEICCLESSNNAPNKEPHLKLISPICPSPL